MSQRFSNRFILSLFASDPVREEKYQESMIRAREKMQRAHDVRADEYMQKKEAVSNNITT